MIVDLAPFLWTDFACSTDTYEFKPESECAFGQPYSISKTFKQTPNENFNITYGDGQFLTGIIGTEQVTIAGITVKNQKVAVVDFAAWTGDGVASGLVRTIHPISFLPIGFPPSLCY